MATEKPFKTPSPYHLGAFDNPSTPLVSILFNVDNYSTWSWVMRNTLVAKNKLGFTNGTLEKPKWGDPNAKAWQMANSMRWLGCSTLWRNTYS